MSDPCDLTRLLLDARGTATLHTYGYCMFPCIQPGDRITVDARRIEKIAVGEIAVFRRGNRIVAHRVVEVGEREGIPYLVTRPDLAWRNERPLTAADVLGVVTRVQRLNHDVSLTVHPTSPFTRILINIYLPCFSYIAYIARKILGHLQDTSYYRALAVRLMAKNHLALTLQVPLLSNMDGLYRSFSLDDVPVDLLRTAPSWSLVLSRNGASAATLTIERDADRPDAWRVREIATRIRYRGMGFEEQLLAACEACLSRLGAARLCIAWPASPGMRRTAQRSGFVESLDMYEKAVSDEVIL